jgi:hypothetical protein
MNTVRRASRWGRMLMLVSLLTASVALPGADPIMVSERPGGSAYDDQGGGGISGDWNWNGNHHEAVLRFSGGAAQLRWGDGTVETLKNVTFEPATGRVSFYREQGDQPHVGELSGGDIHGTFTQYGRVSQKFLWCAARSGKCTLGKSKTPPSETSYSRWFCITPDQRQFAAQPGRTIPLQVVGDSMHFRAGSYMIYAAVCEPDAGKGFVINTWKALGPLTLGGTEKWKASLRPIKDASVDWVVMERNPADLLTYSPPDQAHSMIYARNDDLQYWRGICVLPAGAGMTVEDHCFGGSDDIVYGASGRSYDTLLGTWKGHHNNHPTEFVFSSDGGQLVGIYRIPGGGAEEKLSLISLNGTAVKFTRPTVAEDFIGNLSGNTMSGTFTWQGGTYKWEVTKTK